MKILVCVKVIKGEINPFDCSGLECALRISDDVTVITMGPASNEEVLKSLTRLGAKVILLSDNVFAGSDTLATSYVLSSAIKNMEYDLILCGRQSIDGDTAQVGPMISEMLGINLITNAISVETDGLKVTAKTRVGEESSLLPALITLERGYVLRFPSIFSKQGEITVLDNSSVGCNTEKCGIKGSPTRVLKTFENKRGKRTCKFITFEELLPLIEKLKAEPRSNEKKLHSSQKLKSVWAVGEEVLKKAREIAHEVILIEQLSPEKISERAIKEKPEVILWNADLWGRKNAPIVAAKLNTGLCADCTELEAEDDTLIMYRPAQGGSIYAEIKCLRKPQMATVRTHSNSSDIIVALGRGVADKTEEIESFAKKIGAELAASRGLVDMGKALYESQVGLTGKVVSSKIYIAIGISGAVHHTCAIEDVDTVIAINSDKGARIFEYADYGIVDEFKEGDTV